MSAFMILFGGYKRLVFFLIRTITTNITFDSNSTLIYYQRTIYTNYMYLFIAFSYLIT